MKNWYIYLLLCDRKTFYVGITDDVHKRLLSHKQMLIDGKLGINCIEPAEVLGRMG